MDGRAQKEEVRGRKEVMRVRKGKGKERGQSRVERGA